MKHVFLIALSTVFITFFACKEKDPVVTTQSVSGSIATLAWEDCTLYSSHDLTICFVGAVENRCPCNTECLWEGTVEATFHVTNTTGIDTTITLITNSNPATLHNSTSIGGKTITFVNTDAIGCADYGKYEKYQVIVTVQ